jgi:hypothetical protein
MDEVFPSPIRLPGQPEPPREVPEERRHSPPKIVDEPIDAYSAEAAISGRSGGARRPVCGQGLGGGQMAG